jgi:small subunit ribosomal protein S1
MKQLEPNPYDALRDKYPVGTQVHGRVRNIADFGIFVEIEDGIDGLVHISDLSWTHRVRHPSELYKKGDEVDAVVLNIEFDADKPKISLGIKQTVDDPWNRIPIDYPPGKIQECTVTKVLDFGLLVELEKGVEGLVHISEISEDHVEDPKALFKPGDKVKAEVIAVDPHDRRLGLSIKTAMRSEEMAEVQGFKGGTKTAGATLGDVFKEKLAGLTPEDEQAAQAEAASASEVAPEAEAASASEVAPEAEAAPEAESASADEDPEDKQ